MRARGAGSPRNLPPLFTIGYEKITPAAFHDEVARARVDVLVDVRAIASSRRAGFSKRQLSAGLDEQGIGYLHFRALGTPKEGRLAARAGEIEVLSGIYHAHLGTPDAQHELEQLAALARSGKRVCLLCLERDPHRCHRQWVAEEVSARTGVEVRHLFAAQFGSL